MKFSIFLGFVLVMLSSSVAFAYFGELFGPWFLGSLITFLFIPAESDPISEGDNSHHSKRTCDEVGSHLSCILKCRSAGHLTGYCESDYYCNCRWRLRLLEEIIDLICCFWSHKFFMHRIWNPSHSLLISRDQCSQQAIYNNCHTIYRSGWCKHWQVVDLVCHHCVRVIYLWWAF